MDLPPTWRGLYIATPRRQGQGGNGQAGPTFQFGHGEKVNLRSGLATPEHSDVKYPGKRRSIRWPNRWETRCSSGCWVKQRITGHGRATQQAGSGGGGAVGRGRHGLNRSLDPK